MIYEDIRKEAEDRLKAFVGGMNTSVRPDGSVLVCQIIDLENLRAFAETLLWLAEPESWDDR